MGNINNKLQFYFCNLSNKNKIILFLLPILVVFSIHFYIVEPFFLNKYQTLDNKIISLNQKITSNNRQQTSTITAILPKITTFCTSNGIKIINSSFENSILNIECVGEFEKLIRLISNLEQLKIKPDYIKISIEKDFTIKLTFRVVFNTIING